MPSNIFKISDRFTPIFVHFCMICYANRRVLMEIGYDGKAQYLKAFFFHSNIQSGQIYEKHCS